MSGDEVGRQLLLSRGVVPMLADPSLGNTRESSFSEIDGSMLNRSLAYVIIKL